jgi:hypothetical protein
MASHTGSCWRLSFALLLPANAQFWGNSWGWRQQQPYNPYGGGFRQGHAGRAAGAGRSGPAIAELPSRSVRRNGRQPGRSCRSRKRALCRKN